MGKLSLISEDEEFSLVSSDNEDLSPGELMDEKDPAEHNDGPAVLLWPTNLKTIIQHAHLISAPCVNQRTIQRQLHSWNVKKPALVITVSESVVRLIKKSESRKKDLGTAKW